MSVCVPMRDEIDAIDACLDGFAAQTYPLDRLDVIVVDGGSTDGSRERVEERAARRVRGSGVVDNPRQKAAAAFNRGVEAARGEVFCLFSAHGVPDPDYVARSVAVLAETGVARRRRAVPATSAPTHGPTRSVGPWCRPFGMALAPPLRHRPPPSSTRSATPRIGWTG